jgi:cbb3-type cytochrome oxidase subunit 3
MLLSLSLSAAAAAKSLSFTDRLILWLHIAFVIFTIGPVTVAIMSTPRYIRARNLTVVRYLYRTTRIFVLISLGVLVFGIVLAQQLNDFAKPWLTISMTLFVVAIVLLVIVLRDQRKSITALETAEAADALPPGATMAAAAAASPAAAGVPAADASPEAVDDATAAGQPEPTQPVAVAQARQVATVERGRITTLGAVVTVDWLIILILMVWR